MKVNNRESVDISQMARSKRGEKVAAQKQKEAEQSADSAVVGGTAGVEISSEAKSLAAANQVARADNTDQAKIDRIKAMLANGTYKPDYGKVADKVVNETLLQDLT